MKPVVLPQVAIVGVTPVPGGGVSRDQIRGDVQTAIDQNLRRLQSPNLANFMGTGRRNVHIDERQGNPYHLEVNDRGDSAHLVRAASRLDEHVWRDASPSPLRQLFGRIGQRQGGAHREFSLVLASDRPVGSGPLPESMLEARGRATTRPLAQRNLGRPGRAAGAVPRPALAQ